MNSDGSGYMDYLEGSVNLQMDVTKLANGMTKASCMGHEVNDYNPENAVMKLQEHLQGLLLKNELQLGM